MTLEQAVAGWQTLTQAEARRLIGAAERRHTAAREAWRASGSCDEPRAFTESLALVENLAVFVACGERAPNPLEAVNS